MLKVVCEGSHVQYDSVLFFKGLSIYKTLKIKNIKNKTMSI